MTKKMFGLASLIALIALLLNFQVVWRSLKPGGRLLIADMRRPTGSAFKKFFTSVILHHGNVVEFGLQDLPKLLQEVGFEQVEQLPGSFLTIGFVRARKPSA